MNVLFVCVANGGRSVIAERLFVSALREIGIDASDHVPRRLDGDVLAWADLAVSTCSDEVCPVTPGVRRISWEVPDPKGLPLDRVREIRDQIEQRVEQLIHELEE